VLVDRKNKREINQINQVLQLKISLKRVL